jgi:hypothetical protein
MNPIVTGGGGVFTFTYGTVLTAAEKGDNQDFLSISGIRDYISGSAFSSPLFTPVVVTTAGVTSITWDETTNVTGPGTLNFGFGSASNELGVGQYAYNVDAIDGVELGGTGIVQVPIGGISRVAMTPEPTTIDTLGLFAMVLTVVALGNRRRGNGRAPVSALA